MTEPPTPPLRAGVYVRISHDFTRQGLGVARQEEDCRELAERLGWQVVDVYVDNDISATSGKARPAYRKMLADITAKRLDAVLAWAPDRMYRRIADLEELITIIEANDIEMRTVRAGTLDLTTAYGRMIARVLGAVTAGEGEIKAERWKRSWRQGRERGVVARTGSRLFGYTRDGEIIPAEATIARRMADDVAAGVPILRVARWLEDEGIQTSRGNPWRTNSIKRYLTNPRIAGWSTLGGEILAEGKWEPIIDRDTWETIRAMLTGRTRSYVPRKSLLNGLIFCTCDHRLITGKQRGKRTYRCPNRPGMRGCGHVSGYAEPIEELVQAYAAARLADPAVQAEVARMRTHPARLHQEVTALELRLTELEQQLDQPGVPVTTILRALDRAKQRRDELLSQLAVTPDVTIPAQGSAWPADLARRRALIDLAVKRVVLHPATKPARHGFDPERVDIQPR